MGVNSLPKTVTRQCRGCDLNSGLCAPESSTLTTRPPSHPTSIVRLHWRLAVEIYDVTYNKAERPRLFVYATSQKQREASRQFFYGYGDCQTFRLPPLMRKRTIRVLDEGR